jgi:hypothetical protein
MPKVMISKQLQPMLINWLDVRSGVFDLIIYFVQKKLNKRYVQRLHAFLYLMINNPSTHKKNKHKTFSRHKKKKEEKPKKYLRSIQKVC